MKEKVINLIEQIPVGVITFSATGEVEYINENFKKLGILYSLETEKFKDANIFETNLLPEINLAIELQEILSGIPFEKEIKNVQTNDGGHITLVVKGSPVYDDDKIIGGLLLLEDIKVLAKTREEIKLRTNYIEKAVEEANDFLIVTNSAGDVQYSAGTALEKLKMPSKNVSGKNINELFNSPVKNNLIQNFEKVLGEKKPLTFQFKVELDKKYYEFECKIEPLLNKLKQVQFVYFFFNDITMQVAEKEELEKQISTLQYYKSVTSGINYALLVLDTNLIITYADELTAQIFQIQQSQLEGNHISEIVPELKKKLSDNFLEMIRSSQLQKLKADIGKENQESKIVELRFKHIELPEEKILVLCSDITNELLLSRETPVTVTTLKKLLDNSDEMICKINSSGKIIFANKTFIKKLGYTEDELYEGNFFSSIFQKEIKDNFPELETGTKNEPIEIKMKLLPKQGYPINTFARIIADSDENSITDTYSIFLTDIDEKIEFESELNLYKSLFKSALDGFVVEHEGRIIKANNSFAQIFGYENLEELINKDFLDLVANEDVLKVAEYLRLKENNKNAPDRFEFLGRKRDGAFFYAELSTSVFETEGRRYLAMVARDVTERKRAQKVIRESEEKYRNLTENIDDFLYTFERVGGALRPLFYTSAVEKVTGYSQAEFLSDARLFLKIIHPDDFQYVKTKVSELVKGSLKSSLEIEFRIINKLGNIVWVRNKVNIIRNEEGEIQKLYGLVSDITLKKKAEEELRQSAADLQKVNETKDRFISIISHDLRTPFSSILGFTDLLSTDETLSDAERKQYINYIQESSKSMLSLVNSLLDYTRLQTGRIKFETEKVTAADLIEKSIGTVQGAALQKGIEIKQLVGKDHTIFVDKDLTLQVFNNLLSNAIKFSKEGDTVTISVNPLASSRFIEFSVKDTGMGIKAENINKLFNVDTKFTSEGTAGERGSGLGLSLVKEIIEKHGGSISVESQYGKGSEFKFTLPTASAKILIVDNNTTDRILYSKILKNLTPDFDVDIAPNGKEALKKIESSPPALVITENKMPEMNGKEFIKELINKGIFQSLPVIVLSGSIAKEDWQIYSDLGIEFVFQKPVNLGSFKKALEKSLRKGIAAFNKTK